MNSNESNSSAVRPDRWLLSDAYEPRPGVQAPCPGSLGTFVERDRYRRAKLIWAAAEAARVEGRTVEHQELIERWRRVLNRGKTESAVPSPDARLGGI